MTISVGDITYTVNVDISGVLKAQKAIKDFEKSLKSLKQLSNNINIKINLSGYGQAAKNLRELSKLAKDKTINIKVNNADIKNVNDNLKKVRQKSKTSLNIKVNNAAKVKKDLREIDRLLANIKQNKNIQIIAATDVVSRGKSSGNSKTAARDSSEIRKLRQEETIQRLLLQNRKLLQSARQFSGLASQRIKEPLLEARKELLSLNRAFRSGKLDYADYVESVGNVRLELKKASDQLTNYKLNVRETGRLMKQMELMQTRYSSALEKIKTAGISDYKSNFEEKFISAQQILRSKTTPISQKTKAVAELDRELQKVIRDQQRFTQEVKRVKGLAGLFGKLSDAIKSVGAAYAAFLIFSGIEKLIKTTVTLADETKGLRGQLKLLVKNQKELDKTWNDLIKVAIQTRTDLAPTVKLYTKVAAALLNLGYSSEVALKTVKAINTSLVLSGSSAQEAASTVIQLSQAFSKGKLDGEELRSVLENNQVYALALAKALKVAGDNTAVTTRNVLMASRAGKITLDVMVKAGQAINKELGDSLNNIPIRLGQAVSILKTRFMEVISAIQSAVDYTAMLSKVVLGLANNIKIVTVTIVSLIGALGSMGTGALISKVFKYLSKNMFVSSAKGIMKIVKSFKTLRGAFGWIGLALTGVSAAIAVYKNDLISIKGETYTVGEVLQAVWLAIKDVISKVVDRVKTKLKNYIEFFKAYKKLTVEIFRVIKKNLIDFYNSVSKTLNKLSGPFVAFAKVIKHSLITGLAAIKTFREALGKAWEEKSLSAGIEYFKKNINKNIKEAQDQTFITNLLEAFLPDNAAKQVDEKVIKPIGNAIDFIKDKTENVRKMLEKVGWLFSPQGFKESLELANKYFDEFAYKYLKKSKQLSERQAGFGALRFGGEIVPNNVLDDIDRFNSAMDKYVAISMNITKLQKALSTDIGVKFVAFGNEGLMNNYLSALQKAADYTRALSNETLKFYNFYIGKPLGFQAKTTEEFIAKLAEQIVKQKQLNTQTKATISIINKLNSSYYDLNTALEEITAYKKNNPFDSEFVKELKNLNVELNSMEFNLELINAVQEKMGRRKFANLDEFKKYLLNVQSMTKYAKDYAEALRLMNETNRYDSAFNNKRDLELFYKNSYIAIKNIIKTKEEQQRALNQLYEFYRQQYKIITGYTILRTESDTTYRGIIDNSKKANRSIGASAKQMLNGISDGLVKFYNGLINLRKHALRIKTALLEVSDAFKYNAKNIMKDLASLIDNWVDQMSDRLAEFVAKGKADFRSLLQDMNRQLTSLILRQAIVQPFMEGIKSLVINTSAANAVPTVDANQIGIGQSVDLSQPAGVVSARSRTKTASPVTVNVINKTSQEVTANATVEYNDAGMSINVIVEAAVAEMAANGKLDRIMAQYGARRRGV